MNKDYQKILYNKFPHGQYALLDEVRDEAGFGASRAIDVLAIGLWPSRGNEVHGIEVKSGREIGSKN
jgi:hypothetical protein